MEFIYPGRGKFLQVLKTAFNKYVANWLLFNNALIGNGPDTDRYAVKIK